MKFLAALLSGAAFTGTAYAIEPTDLKPETQASVYCITVMAKGLNCEHGGEYKWMNLRFSDFVATPQDMQDNRVCEVLLKPIHEMGILSGYQINLRDANDSVFRICFVD